MERREAIKNIGFSLGAMVATPSMLGLLQSCQAQEDPWTPMFFTEDQGKFVKKLANTFLPASGNLPSATEVNVHVFMDKFSQEVMSVDIKPVFRRTISKVIADLLTISGKETIGDVNSESYEKLLSTYLLKSKTENQKIMRKVKEYKAQNDDELAGIAKELIFYDFFNNFRDMVVWAYKTNEVVGKTIMAYKPVPGEQRGCVDLLEATGGMGWSLIR
ncbi:MAG: gluconate 2-dehydrogenase subunit 3 family protein [Ekhidna sp.]|nr:gluconate 2-dehydrogenase subunit 3 family protein [Ekhidna sp.]